MLLSTIVLQAAAITWGPVAGAIGAAIAALAAAWGIGKIGIRKHQFHRDTILLREDKRGSQRDMHPPREHR